MPTTCARAALVLAALVVCGPPVSALNPALDINQYAHTAWTIRQGVLNTRVRSIAQTPDGYLWLGTETGLLRFDGVRTMPWAPRGEQRLPSAQIIKLLAGHDGRLWIGTPAGLASWKDGNLVTYPELAGSVVMALAEDSRRTVWAGTLSVPRGRLCAIRAAVECVGDDGRLGVGVFSLREERGTLWVGAASGLWRWSDAPPVRYSLPGRSVTDLVGLAGGSLLIAVTGGLEQLVGDKLVNYRIPGDDRPLQAIRLLRDRDGALWIGTLGQGLVHVHNGVADRFTRADGLSGDSIDDLFEDREGNVWVVTTEGVDRFRELPVTSLSTRQRLSGDLAFSIMVGRDRSVWMGTSDGLNRWQDGRLTVYRTGQGLPDDHAATVFEDSRGRILVSTLRGMAAFQGGRFVRIPALATRVVYNIVEDRAGGLWINDQEQGLLHFVGDRVVRRIPWSAVGHQDHATALAADHGRDGLWVGFYNGGLAFVKDGAVRTTYGASDGLGGDRISQIQVNADGTLWVATTGGLSHITEQRIATLSRRNGLPCDAVHTFIEDADRIPWLVTACGLVRVQPDELAAWVRDPARRVQVTLFDSSDGVRTQATPLGSNPPAARLPDGRLWFATVGGVAIVDPRHLPVNTLPPLVQIEQIVGDRKTYDVRVDPGGSVRLPPRVHDLQIDYTALSLAAPEKVRFRYKLEGADRDWQEVGNRRQAFYTDLPPREYRFRVAAANNSGVWNDTGAAVAFSIAPAYYQTWWFVALSGFTLTALIWSAHRARLRIVERHKREISALNERLMGAQEQERIRIAGELHDGVMQEMFAATMMLGTAKRRASADAETEAAIEKIQQKLIRVGNDIRQLSHDLHPPALQDAGLPGAVRAYCEQFSASCGIPVACEADERVRDLSRGAALALFRIVQEALGNTAKYARATSAAVRLTRAAALVSLTVSDDGVGFDAARLGVSGGLGLVMMRERAGQLNGTFEFETAPGRGTTIRVVIPFR